jgi:hypothetical protein
VSMNNDDNDYDDYNEISSSISLSCLIILYI